MSSIRIKDVYIIKTDYGSWLELTIVNTKTKDIVELEMKKELVEEVIKFLRGD